ncbi:MAG: magnesium transporter [Candidatus Izemoplasmatales bacterium]
MNEELKEELAERDYVAEVADLIRTRLDDPAFVTLLDEYHPFDVSHALLGLEPELRRRFFAAVPVAVAANVFEHFEREDAISCIREIPTPAAVAVIDAMDTDDAVDLLQYLEETESDIDLVNQLSPKKRNELKKYWSYADVEIGSVMSNSFVELGVSMKVPDAMKKLTGIAGETEYISILYVVDKQKLVGSLHLKDLILARASQTIGEIMEPHVVSADPHASKETVARMMLDYGNSSMPIAEDGRIVGIVTYDDLMDVIDEIKTEDYAKFASVAPAEIAAEEKSVKLSVKSRLPWLLVLLALSTLSSIALSLFDGAFTSSDGARRLAAELAIFLPLLLDMSGNSGTQSLAVMIRYLAKNDNVLKRAQIKRTLRREIVTGLIEGLGIGLVVFGVGVVTAAIADGWPPAARDIAIGAVTAFAIAVALLTATVLGAFVPLLMSWLKKDPAVASGPFITTLADIATLVIYYALSLAVLLPLYASA